LVLLQAAKPRVLLLNRAEVVKSWRPILLGKSCVELDPPTAAASVVCGLGLSRMIGEGALKRKSTKDVVFWFIIVVESQQQRRARANARI
jgi:hypothetical protein